MRGLEKKRQAAWAAAREDCWGKQARHYDDLVGQVTRQTVGAMLSAINLQPGIRMLDVASGPGYVAAEATQERLRERGGRKRCKLSREISSTAGTDHARHLRIVTHGSAA